MSFIEAVGRKMKSKQLRSFQVLVQFVGAVFLGVFLSAYLFSLPAGGVLHGELFFHELLALFGGLFFIFVLIALLLSAMRKIEN